MALDVPDRRSIRGFPAYGVDADGRVWRLRSSGAWRPVAVWDSPAGHGRGTYPRVQLWHQGSRKNAYVHVLVARAFPEVCGLEFDGAVVRHLDGNQSNPRASNLRFGTWGENEADKSWHAEHGRGTVRETSIQYIPDADLGF
jgi:hypothetical protein